MYLSIIIWRMTPGFTRGLFPLPIPYLCKQSTYGIMGWSGPTRWAWPVTECLASYWACSQGPRWRLWVQLESSLGSGPNHLKFQVPLSRETEQVLEGGSCSLFREGRMEEPEADPLPLGMGSGFQVIPRGRAEKGKLISQLKGSFPSFHIRDLTQISSSVLLIHC